jgi:thymidylate synthase
MKIISVEAVTLPDSWFQLVYNALEHGKDFKIDSGSFKGHIRKEFDFVVVNIKRPFERDTEGLPLIPEMPESCSDIPAPVDSDYLVQYIPYIMGDLVGGKPEEKESYTYGQRITKEPVRREICRNLSDPTLKEIYKCYPYSPEIENLVLDSEKFFSQVNQVIWEYKKNGHRNNQLVIQIAKPTDLLLLDPPCLRQIDTRIQDGKLHFFPYFRSWDLWSGYPANLAGISVLQEYMAEQIGVEQGEMLCTSKGLHLYDYSVPFAKMRCMF